MLRLARDQERTAAELAAAAGLSPSAASPHLKLLRESGLLQMRADAKRRLYHVDPGRLADLRDLLDDMWGDRLDALRAAAETGRSADARPDRSA